MKNIIQINFQGHIVPIEASAHTQLQDYLSKLKVHFAKNEHKEEIIGDVENRISEYFQNLLQEDNFEAISAAQVDEMITNIGFPDDFESSQFSRSATQNFFDSSEPSKKLYRAENQKIIGGVCAGIAQYANIDVAIVRIVSVILISVFLVPYIVLWIVLPKAVLEFPDAPKDQKRLFRDITHKKIAGVCAGLANYTNISVTLVRVFFLLSLLSLVPHWDFSNWFGIRLMRISLVPTLTLLYVIFWICIPPNAPESIGNSASSSENMTSNESDNQIPTAQPNELLNTKNTTLGDIIALLFKVILYCFLGMMILVLLVSLGAIGVAVIGFKPVADFFIYSTFQQILLWIGYICTIWIPIAAICWWVFRLLTKRKRSAILTSCFFGLWIVGIVAIIFSTTSILKQNKTKYFSDEQTMPLIKSQNFNTLSIDALNQDQFIWNSHDMDWQLGDLDSLNIGNVQLRFEPAKGDSFSFSVRKYATGNDEMQARNFAKNINFHYQQIDSTLYLSHSLSIDKINKFHNQRLIYTIYVPVGKQIYIHSDFSNQQIAFYASVMGIKVDDDYIFNRGVDADKLYVMTVSGLEEKNKDNNENTNWSSDNEDNDNGVSVSTVQQDINNQFAQHKAQINRSIDSLKKEQNAIDQKMQLKKERLKTLQKEAAELQKELDN